MLLGVWTIQILNLKNENFKQDFETTNDFGCKSHQQQGCRTHQGLQLLFWSFLHRTK
jgi:hypothetical protein